MSDYTLPPCCTVIAGMTGSGKTTFAFRALLNLPCACRFVFDDLGQAAARLGPCLGLTHASTSFELEEAVKRQWVLFNPHRMFPGNVEGAFRFFCDWTFKVSQRGPGKKILLVDEVWRFQSPHGIPRELAMVSQAGRSENLELMVATQLPHKVHASITGQSTELVTFRLQERLALECVQELDPGANPGALPLGSFSAVNRLNAVRLDGKLW